MKQVITSEDEEAGVWRLLRVRPQLDAVICNAQAPSDFDAHENVYPLVDLFNPKIAGNLNPALWCCSHA